MLGIPSNFKFILYKHGPYSFDLSERLQGLISNSLLSVLTRPPYGPTLGVAMKHDRSRLSLTAMRASLRALRLCQRNLAKKVWPI